MKTQSPSDALIEGIVVKNFDNNEWIVTGEVERNNALVVDLKFNPRES